MVPWMTAHRCKPGLTTTLLTTKQNVHTTCAPVISTSQASNSFIVSNCTARGILPRRHTLLFAYYPLLCQIRYAMSRVLIRWLHSTRAGCGTLSPGFRLEASLFLPRMVSNCCPKRVFGAQMCWAAEDGKYHKGREVSLRALEHGACVVGVFSERVVGAWFRGKTAEKVKEAQVDELEGARRHFDKTCTTTLR